MKKYFIKTISLTLLIGAFHLASGFCFEGLLNPLAKVEAAQAAPLENNLTGEMDTCSQSQAVSPLQSQSDAIISHLPNSAKTVLPCCLDGAQANLAALNQSLEIKPLMPAAIITPFHLPTIILVSAVYYPPIISPPKLLAVKTTVLRL